MSINLEIQRLRGIAILLVMLSHFYLLSSKFPLFLQNSWVGVDLFFVISGYVVTISFMNSIFLFEKKVEKIKIKNYLIIIKQFLSKGFLE